MDAAGGVGGQYRRWRRAAALPSDQTAEPLRRMLSEARWQSLPAAVRERFRRRVKAGACVTYVGEVVECRMSRIGRLFAQLARLVGAPLPLHRDTGVPACVSVTEDIAGGGQFWTRQYGRRRGFPQVIFSAKRFAGPTGMEEYLGLGFGIALRAEVEGGALWFLSDHYFLRLGRLRLRFPRWLAPGGLAIGHIDCGGGRFLFLLELNHRLAGELIRQLVIFQDPDEGAVA